MRGLRRTLGCPRRLPSLAVRPQSEIPSQGLRALPTALQASGAHPEFFQPEFWIPLLSPPAPQYPSRRGSALPPPPHWSFGSAGGDRQAEGTS